MTLQQLQQKRINLAAEANDLEARLKAIRHELVDVCDAIEAKLAVRHKSKAHRRAS